MTVAVLVPVKDLSHAKTRLAQVLSREERGELAGILLHRVLETVAHAELVPPGDPAAAGPLRRVVVTAHQPAADLAARLGFEVLPERQPVSESDSVDRASARLAAEGVRGVLRIPLDLPLIDGKDLARIFVSIREGVQAILVPSASGEGTNALYRAPPNLFPSRFGAGSLALHEQEARRAGVEPRILPLDSFALDVDDPEDVRALLRRGAECPALDWLRDRGIAARLDVTGG